MTVSKAILIALLFGVGAISYLATRFILPHGPMISCPRSVDLGRQVVGAKVAAKVPITNVGGKPLQLSAFISSCGCLFISEETVGPITSTTTLDVLPGETIELLVHLAVRGNPGLLLKEHIFFASNCPTNAQLRIELSCTTEGSLVPVPSQVLALDVETGATFEKTVFIKDTGASRVDIDHVEHTLSTLLTSAKLTSIDPTEPEQEAGEARHCARIDLCFNAPFEPGVYEGEIRAIGQDGSTLVSIPARISVVYPLVFDPSTILLPRISGTSVATDAPVVCRSRASKRFLLECVSKPEHVTVHVAKSEGEEHKITVSFSPGPVHPQPGIYELGFRAAIDANRHELRLPIVIQALPRK
ncbi:MAG: DUF1573 domain-containing protein [Gemmataceae bacterium]|nr:DUF1573 domain-containing protein [Gemmataceae bacterium]